MFNFDISWYWKALAAVLGLLGLIALIGASFTYMHTHGKNEGVLECQAAEKSAAVKALEDAKKGYDDAMAQLYEDEDEINNTKPEDDDLMGRGLVDTLNGL